MAFWIFLVSMLALLSYLADVGVPAFVLLRQPVPFLRASTISVALIICCVFMLLRVARLARRGEKERMKARMDHLETELKEIGKDSLKRESERLVKSWQSSKRQPHRDTEVQSPEWDKGREEEKKEG
jgi:hypothetical protein